MNNQYRTNKVLLRHSILANFQDKLFAKNVKHNLNGGFIYDALIIRFAFTADANKPQNELVSAQF